MKLRLATIAFLFGFLFIFIHGSPTHAQVSSALRHLPHERTANIPEIRDRTKLETYRSLVRNFRVDGVPHERHVNVNLKTSAGWLASGEPIGHCLDHTYHKCV